MDKSFVLMSCIIAVLQSIDCKFRIICHRENRYHRKLIQSPISEYGSVNVKIEKDDTMNAEDIEWDKEDTAENTSVDLFVFIAN